MKIAISAVGDNLDVMMDPRFGRATYFLIVDSNTLAYEAFINPNVEVMGGAGIQSAQLVLEKGAQAVITGSCGPNAYRVLQAAGISIYEAAIQPVRDLLKAFLEKQLQIIDQPVGKKPGWAKGINHLKSVASVTEQTGNSDQLQEKVQQVEKRLQEINRRLEALEKQRDPVK